MAAAVAIALQGALDEGVLDAAALQRLAASAGLLVRRASSAPADLMVSRGCSTLPFLLWRPGGDGGSSGGGGGGGANTDRIARLAATYRHSYVLVPHELLSDPAVLEATCSHSASGALSFVFMPCRASFTEQALALACSLLPAEAEEAAWRQQQAQAVTSSQAICQVLQGLPLPTDGDAGHHVNLLRLLGSLKDLSQHRADEIAAHTDLSPRAAHAVAAFFDRGGQQAVAPPGPELACHLQAL